ncbi:hypothetical protein [Actinacidiphila alni]|uniref:hypothetical protein n=1 Tax=Actinacidiphila alni TaxID=380248 RepID=UPI0034542938
MSGRGRRASLPPADHASPAAHVPGSLVVAHRDADGHVAEYDFSALPVAEPMQRSLAVLFARRCRPNKWASLESSLLYWRKVKEFTVFLSQLERPPGDLDEITAPMVKRWRTSLPRTGGGYNALTKVASLLGDDARLQSGPVADELAERMKRPASKTQSYSEAEFDKIKVAARRQFRSALLRIDENAQHLERWRRGEIVEGSRDWVIGEGLDALARTGELPYAAHPGGQRTLAGRYRRAFGGARAEVTWQRLFLSQSEAIGLSVLLLAAFGWNTSVINRAEIPKAAPDAGEDGRPTYRILLEKRRRGAGNYFETRNVTDERAGTAGRLITEALRATRFARTIVEELAPGTDRLVVWHALKIDQDHSDPSRLAPVGWFHFGIPSDAASPWGRDMGFSGSPFRRGRRTVNALDRRQPGQNSQASHDRDYALVDKRVQTMAVETIARGAEDAADRARKAVLVAELRDEPDEGDVETATADCHDFDNGPFPAPGGGCGASFLMCLGCENARVHPGHHPRLVHLHQALTNLRSVLPPQAWESDWGDVHDRLENLKGKLGDGQWAQAQDRVTDTDRTLIKSLLSGELDA